MWWTAISTGSELTIDFGCCRKNSLTEICHWDFCGYFSGHQNKSYSDQHIILQIQLPWPVFLSYFSFLSTLGGGGERQDLMQSCWPQTDCVTKSELGSLLLLSLAPKYCDYSQAWPCLAFISISKEIWWAVEIVQSVKWWLNQYGKSWNPGMTWMFIIPTLGNQMGIFPRLAHLAYWVNFRPNQIPYLKKQGGEIIGITPETDLWPLKALSLPTPQEFFTSVDIYQELFLLLESGILRRISDKLGG